MFDLKGKVAVVTGASSGLGADAALAYAEAGADVALLARRLDKLEEVKTNIEKLGRKAIVVQVDVTSEESVKQGIEKVYSFFGHIDILLNNAGVAVHGGVHNMSVENWDKAFNTNIKGIFLVSKYVIPHMMAQKYGKVVNVASVNAVIADKGELFARHSYNATKAGVVGLTKGMSCSYAMHNITVNAVGPGLFESEMTINTLFKSQEFLDKYNSINPTGRPAKTGELNGTLLYLSSDASSYVQGQFILVDGGLTNV